MSLPGASNLKNRKQGHLWERPTTLLNRDSDGDPTAKKADVEADFPLSNWPQVEQIALKASTGNGNCVRNCIIN